MQRYNPKRERWEPMPKTMVVKQPWGKSSDGSYMAWVVFKGRMTAELLQGGGKQCNT